MVEISKEKIEFSDILAGDLLEIVQQGEGVKTVTSGVAFEKRTGWIYAHEATWHTSEGGILVFEFDHDTIFRVRIDV